MSRVKELKGLGDSLMKKLLTDFKGAKEGCSPDRSPEEGTATGQEREHTEPEFTRYRR